MPELRLVTLCTGNASRSVLAGALLAARRPGLEVVTAGTHVVEHQPMSVRTRRAFEHLGLPVPAHRSHQIAADDVARADLVVAMAGEHVAYVRRRLPEAADRTATVRWLASHLPPGPPSLAERVAELHLADVVLDPADDIEDPAGGDDDTYRRCAEAVADAVGALVERL